MKSSNVSLPLILSFLTLGLLAVGATTYYVIKSPQPASELELLTQSVQQEDLTVRIKANGTVEPIQSVNISPQEPGRLLRLFVEQGQRVKQGQRLAVMENSQLQAQGVEAEARLKEAIANLEQAKINIPAEIRQLETDLSQAKLNYAQNRARYQEAQKSIPKQIDQANADLKAAQARLELAAKQTARYEYLSQQGAATLDQLDVKINEYKNAQAAVFQAQQRLEELKNTAQPKIDQLGAAVAEAQVNINKQELLLIQKKDSVASRIDQLEAQIEASQAQLKRMEIKFLDTIITAPFDGIITQKYATEGAFVTPTTSASSTASATSTSIIALARGLEIIAQVPEVDIQQIRLGQDVEIIADAYPDEVFLGKVILISPEAIEEQNVTSFEVKISLISGQEKLLSKMNVDVTFLGEPISNALIVPTVAIVTQDGQTGVMIPDQDGKPIFQPVTIGLTLNNNTEILSGLKIGDRFFIDLPKKYRQQDD